MKITKLFPVMFAAGLAGVALAKFGNAEFLAFLPGDELFALAASAALVAFAVYDYSRRHEPLRPRVPVSRPTMPSVPSAWPTAPAARTRNCERTAA